MARRTVEELRGCYRKRMVDLIDEMESDVRDWVESPIEELLVWALVDNDHDIYSSFSMPSKSVLGGDGDTPCLFLMPESNMPFSHIFALQPTVVASGRRYRLDIALETGDGKSTRVYVAIECDGHDFHEKTKEQAESDKRRDRDLQSIGWTIARFTGAEIYRDPDAAAKSVADLAWAQLNLRMEAAANALDREKKGGR